MEEWTRWELNDDVDERRPVLFTHAQTSSNNAPA